MVNITAQKALTRIAGFMMVILLLVNVSFFNGCSKNKDIDENVVAEYGNGKKITFIELKQYVFDWNYNKRYREESEGYRHALNDMLKNQMKRVDFFELHLDTNETLTQSINRIINEALVANYFDKEYLNKYINDDFAKNIYGIMGKRVEYQEIVLKKPEGAAKSKLAKIEKQALNIKEQIDNGADFSKLVQKYSQDKKSAQNNGYAAPVNWRQSVSDPVGGAVFKLKENDVRVLSTNTDYRIVKITKITKTPLEPFEKIKDKVINEIKQVYSHNILDKYNHDKDALIDTTSLKWNEAALKQLVKWSNSKWPDAPDLRRNAYEDTLKRVISKSDNKTILIYRNGKVDYKEYLRLLEDILTINVRREINQEDIKNFIIEAVTTNMIVKKADSLGLRKKIFNAYTQDPEIKDRLVYFYNQAEIEQKIPPLTEENLHNFYMENKNSIFYQLEKVNLYAMYFNNLNDAQKVYDKIKSGTEFEKVTGRFFVKTYVRERNGEFKTLMKGEKPIFAEKGFKMKLGEVSEPVKFVDEDGQTKYAVLKCKYTQPEKQLTFDEAKKTIDREFKDFYRKKLETEVEKRLAEKYHPKYYYDVVSKMISAK